MRPSALVSSVALAVASVSHADIFQYTDCDFDGSLFLTELEPEPYADLSGLYLGCADLFAANLSGADLSGADLFAANLYHADLSGVSLNGANLTGADLFEANLSGADLSGANLTNAYLSRADLSGANLSGANLTGANLTETSVVIIVADQTGSCCTNSGCGSISESNCSAMGGTWTEGGSCDDCSPAFCSGDITGDAIVGFDDLVIVISNWGACP